MAWAPSVSDIETLIKYVWLVVDGFQSAPREFGSARQRVKVVRIILSQISRASRRDKCILNRDLSIREEVRDLLGECYMCMKDVRIILKKFSSGPMNAVQRAKWIFTEKANMSESIIQLECIISGFKTYIQMLGIIGPDAIDIQLERNNDPDAAVDAAIANSKTTITAHDRIDLTNYSRSSSRLLAENGAHQGKNGTTSNSSDSLSCWSIVLVTRPGETSYELPRREQRSQMRLREMVLQFDKSIDRLPNGAGHARVQYVLNEANKQVHDHRFAWEYRVGIVKDYATQAGRNVSKQTVLVVLQKYAKTEGDTYQPRPTTMIRPPIQRVGPRFPGTNPLTPIPQVLGQRIGGPLAAGQARRAVSPATNVSSKSSRCHWAGRCKTQGCNQDHPGLCALDKNCRDLKCHRRHSDTVMCKNLSCRDMKCNHRHYKDQCPYNTCSDTACRLRHSAGQRFVPGTWV